MKKLALIISLLFNLCSYAQSGNGIPPRPNPPRLVNDFAKVMTPEQIDDLEHKLVAYDDSTSNQIVIVTIPSTQDNDISDIALGILRTWGVGNKDKNNGIVIVAAIEDHKVWIATGYGLEGAVPDITAKAIIDNDILPNFRQQNYYAGFNAATTSLIKAAAGEYKAPEGYNKRGKGSGIGLGKIIIGIIIFFIIMGMIGRGGGGGGGGYMSRRGSGWLGPMILGSMLGRGSGGGGFGGGGFGGGGGGFGGFGGGSGGGGGAGGSW